MHWPLTLRIPWEIHSVVCKLIELRSFADTSLLGVALHEIWQVTSKMRLEWQREPLKILKWIPSREELWESVPENWKSEIPGLSGNGLIACFICHFDTTWDHLGENSTEELSRSGFPEGVVFIVPWCRKTTPPWAGQFPKQGFLKGWGLKLNRKRICSLLFAYDCGCDLTSSLNVLFSLLPQSNGF